MDFLLLQQAHTNNDDNDNNSKINCHIKNVFGKILNTFKIITQQKYNIQVKILKLKCVSHQLDLLNLIITKILMYNNKFIIRQL